MKKAVVLLSGGLDSATTLYYAQSKGYAVCALIFDYGQRHRRELKSAMVLARKADVPFKLVQISLPWKGSALLDKTIRVPRQLGKKIPSTYVPARNIIFVSFAASYAEAIGARAIFIGANAIDYSGYPDCRPEFFAAFQKALDKGLRAGVEKKGISILTPLVKMTKAQIISLGTKLGVPYHMTWSCYEGNKTPCGVCDSCRLRARGFQEAGMKDPVYGARKS
ncbi:MAG: 7-cyano-7-deazaguanine synthase QueC [Candidatus Omnitrophica bacterium]|nr:7-cyano-7-deazaguanine synthase QueC [Candidatus Omnitrophota bacterium]